MSGGGKDLPDKTGCKTTGTAQALSFDVFSSSYLPLWVGCGVCTYSHLCAFWRSLPNLSWRVSLLTACALCGSTVNSSQAQLGYLSVLHLILISVEPPEEIVPLPWLKTGTAAHDFLKPMRLRTAVR